MPGRRGIYISLPQDAACPNRLDDGTGHLIGFSLRNTPHSTLQCHGIVPTKQKSDCLTPGFPDGKQSLHATHYVLVPFSLPQNGRVSTVPMLLHTEPFGVQ